MEHSGLLRNSTRVARVVAFLVGLICAAAPWAQALPVIPGAAGYGMDTPAGRGGQVIKVTNLKDSGPGSLKACIDADGPRVCVFEVSGTIELTSDLVIRKPYITIAGQTAPSPGITIRGAALWVQTSHVLIQHMRVRVGDNPIGPNPENRDALKISAPGGLSHVVIDHCSFSWGLDETGGTWDTAGDVTFWKNIFAEALNNSLHPKGAHGFGVLFGPDEHTRATMYGNLMAHFADRSPLSRTAELVVVNNVVYNWRWRGTELQGEHGIVTNNTIIGNYYKPGPNSTGPAISMRGEESEWGVTPGSKAYFADNFAAGYDPNNPWAVVRMGKMDDSVKAASPPVWNDGLVVLPHAEAYEMVLATAGARPADRDPVDQRIINDVRQGTGRIIDSQNDVGGWPELAVNYRELVIPPDPSGDADGDGYTNLEEWLHGYARIVEGVKAYAELEVDGQRYLITPADDNVTVVVPFGTVEPPLITVVPVEEMQVARVTDAATTYRVTQAATVPGEGLVEIIGADGRVIHTAQVRFYMARPPVRIALGADTLSWVPKVRGQVRVTVAVDGPAAMVKRVMVDVVPVPAGSDSPVGAPTRVYEGSAVPTDLVVDTIQLEDGPYDWVATVEAVQGLIAEAAVRYSVDNWVLFVDDLKPPEDIGWWGTVDNTMTIEESAGWAYATDNPLEFYRDAHRKVRVEDSEQYLVWKSTGFRNYAVTLYALDTAIDSFVELAVSADRQAWQPLPYTKTVESGSESGWHKVVLAGEMPEHENARYLRLVLRPGGRADALQLGRVQFEHLAE